jgi:hypothetical protein
MMNLKKEYGVQSFACQVQSIHPLPKFDDYGQDSVVAMISASH